MAELFSQYSSGVQFTAGTIAGSTLGASGLNPIVDRLNSITSADNLIIGSVVSGTSTIINASIGSFASFSNNKTSYASIGGAGFLPPNSSGTYTISIADGHLVNTTAGSDYFSAKIQLPHSAVVTSATVHGDNTANQWVLYRNNNSDDADVLAFQNIGSVETSISVPTIDNSDHNYYFRVEVDNSDSIYGATVGYTTDYD